MYNFFASMLMDAVGKNERTMERKRVLLLTVNH